MKKSWYAKTFLNNKTKDSDVKHCYVAVFYKLRDTIICLNWLRGVRAKALRVGHDYATERLRWVHVRGN